MLPLSHFSKWEPDNKPRFTAKFARDLELGESLDLAGSTQIIIEITVFKQGELELIQLVLEDIYFPEMKAVLSLLPTASVIVDRWNQRWV